MSELIIERLSAPVLRELAQPIMQCDGELRDLVALMFETMYAAQGQGLAAPQVGISRRVAVINVPPRGTRIVLVNPRITAVSRASSRSVEGCLSIPGVWDVVERPADVEVVALDAAGTSHTYRVRDELARCFQHEIDHLNGVLYIDRLSPLARQLALGRYRKLTRAAAHAGR
ncbi:MAG TPA: peptide deformylase [Longimicrobiales bacterium]|nr:peptide deformylase [Longimicrobiales bacterium]